MLNQETLQKIKEFAVAGDWDAAFQGASRGNQHLFRMVTVAIFLAEQLDADKALVEASAWLHDFPLTSGLDYDHDRNEKVTNEILDNFSLTEEEKNQIAICAAGHEGTGEMKSLEAQIVHDADVLEKTGILGIIRHTWKLVHSDDSSIIVSDAELSKIVSEHLQWRAGRLQTTLAKDIHSYLVNGIDMSIGNMQRMITIIKPLAQKDMITENIAKELEKILAEYEIQKLREQLSLEYLEKFK